MSLKWQTISPPVFVETGQIPKGFSRRLQLSLRNTCRMLSCFEQHPVEKPAVTLFLAPHVSQHNHWNPPQPIKADYRLLRVSGWVSVQRRWRHRAKFTFSSIPKQRMSCNLCKWNCLKVDLLFFFLNQHVLLNKFFYSLKKVKKNKHIFWVFVKQVLLKVTALFILKGLYSKQHPLFQSCKFTRTIGTKTTCSLTSEYL